MLKLQSEINSAVNPDWLKTGYPFLRAALMEGAEAIDHAGWKWWKKQDRVLLALQMEIIDIWHFYLSAKLASNKGNIPLAAKELRAQAELKSVSVDFDSKTYTLTTLNLIEKLELLIGLAVSRRMSIPLFSAIMKECSLSWDDLYQNYVGKNTLNLFRQANGYKEGTYRKIWDGREDNEHLLEIQKTVDFRMENYQKALYIHLEQKYRSTLASKTDYAAH